MCFGQAFENDDLDREDFARLDRRRFLRGNHLLSDEDGGDQDERRDEKIDELAGIGIFRENQEKTIAIIARNIIPARYQRISCMLCVRLGSISMCLISERL